MSKRKLEDKTYRGIKEQVEEEFSKPDLTTLLQSVQKEVSRLQELITTRLPTDVAINTNPTNQMTFASDCLNSLGKPASSQEPSCRVHNQVEDCCYRENDPECLSAAGSSTTFWSAESLLVENVAMATECGHLFCETCIRGGTFSGGAEALCPRCGEKVGVWRKIYL